MNTGTHFLNASEAAERLGVSAKTLRVWEKYGLIKPVRTSAGWRTYGSAEMARAIEIAALRRLGLSLAQVGRVLRGAPADLESVLASHQTALENRIHQLAHIMENVRTLRADIARGKAPAADRLATFPDPTRNVSTVMELPWPWGGEKFELRDIRRLNYITGPLGSGKTRLAHAIAQSVPGAGFIGLERVANGGAFARTPEDQAVRSCVDHALEWLQEDGAEISPALIALLVALESTDRTTLVVDMIEHGLNQTTQEALIAYLRHGADEARTLFLLTRSSAILDLTSIGADEAIILCPANHSPPIRVAPFQGASGYEAVATCLASPAVRARTEGMIAVRPHVA